MKRHKFLQHLYHKTCTTKDDAKNISYLRMSPDLLVDGITDYFLRDCVVIYPSKSYAVGVIYSWLISIHFKEDFLKTLNDPDLLYGNDPYFVPYSSDKDVYDQVLRRIKPQLELIKENKVEGLPYQVRTTVKYFMDEFFIGRGDEEIIQATVGVL